MFGSATNSFGPRMAKVTWPVWLVSNILLVSYTGYRGEWGLLLMNAFNLATSLNGLARSWVNCWGVPSSPFSSLEPGGSPAPNTTPPAEVADAT